ncbi:CvpA family protein [Reichenbachiella carrageenanivorans]|uniref:CvpA family protein n=1 Tax=Reichenbachiella carrageenanivorans TaxID=2979869 RepID=A0ABY6D4Z8_9BACT|nr:CvpA family protein [Reichenbachiella carrageenanivorans]UXX80193.1 CvpA family protein [Reichenbachiella carrageenanivorans]
MNTIDIVILIFLLIGAYTGFRRGMLMEIVSLAAFFVAILAGIKLLDWGISILAEYIEGYDSLLPIIAFTIIFIGIIVMLNLLGKVVKRILDLTLLGSLDDIIGSMMGIIKWALFISIFFWIFESFGGKISDTTTEDSLLYGPIAAFAPKLFNLISDLFPTILDFFEHSKELVNQQELNV